MNGKLTSWDIPINDQKCGASATYTVTPTGHLVVNLTDSLQVTFKRDEIVLSKLRYLDFFFHHHHDNDLSEFSHGLLGTVALEAVQEMSPKKSTSMIIIRSSKIQKKISFSWRSLEIAGFAEQKYKVFLLLKHSYKILETFFRSVPGKKSFSTRFSWEVPHPI